MRVAEPVGARIAALLAEMDPQPLLVDRPGAYLELDVPRVLRAKGDLELGDPLLRVQGPT